MEEKEIILNGKKIKVQTKLPQDMIEENIPVLALEDTIELPVLKETDNE